MEECILNERKKKNEGCRKRSNSGIPDVVITQPNDGYNEYRNQVSTIFDEIDNGETVFIRRNGIVYSLVKLEDDEQTMKDYPEFQQLADMGRCITAPHIIQLMFEEYHYLLPLYEAVQDSALCAPIQLKDTDERVEVTLTLFVTKVMKQPRTLFKNDSEKLAAMREFVKDEYRPQNMSDAQLDTILLQYDYDLWKGVLQMNKER